LNRAAALKSGPLDAERKAAGGGAVDLDVGDVGIGQKVFDDWLEVAVGDDFSGKEVAAGGVSFKSARTVAEILGKSTFFRIPRASVCVNIDRARLRKRFDPGKAIVGKEYSVVRARPKCMQAVAAGSVVCGDFGVNGKIVKG